MDQPAVRRIKVGIFLPFTEYMMDGQSPRWADVLAFAQRSEDLGFDSVWLGEHLIFHFDEPHPWTGVPGHRDSGPWECWSIISALAAVTKRVEIGPLVSCTGFHNPALLAKMADTIDEISGGRLVLGLGAGWNEIEYRMFGYPFDHRASRFEEAITIIHSLLRTGQVDFEGTYYQARECELRPRGPRPQGPPILVGTTGPRMLRLVARYADAWNVDLWGSHTPDEIPPLRAAVDVACRDAGRDPASLERTIALNMNPTGAAHVPTSSAIQGTPEELAGVLRGFVQEGITHFQIGMLPCTLASLEAFAPVREHLDRG